MLEPRSKGAKPANENKIGTGRGTLRLRSKGPATVEEEVRLFVPSLGYLLEITNHFCKKKNTLI